MAIFQRFQKILAMPLIVSFLLTMLPAATVHAGMVGTDEVLSQSSIRADRARVIEFVERNDVRQQMQTLGVDPEEAKQRVQTLSESEIQQIAGQLDQAPAGEGAVGAIVGAVVLIFLVLLVTDILCLTHVFPFTRCL